MNHQNKLSRREFLHIAGIGAAGLVVTGCGGQKTPRNDAVSATPTRTRKPSIPTSTSVVKEAAINNTARVAIQRCENYDPANVRKALETMFDQIGGLGDVVRPGARVAVKVNLTGGYGSLPNPEYDATTTYVTHPEVVHALMELLKDAGASSLILTEAIWHPMDLSAWGYQDWLDSLGVSVVDLNGPSPYQDFAIVPTGSDFSIFNHFTLNRMLGEIDAFISVSKMKCHAICGVTHSMKNLVGITPLSVYNLQGEAGNRQAIHGTDQEVATHLPGAVVDLNRTRPIHLAVIDGIMTVEGGEGPWIPGMNEIEPKVLIAGKNPVSTDAVATAVMGFDPTAPISVAPFTNAENHLTLAREAGLGTNRLLEIEVVGERIEDVVTPFNAV
jgi:uncharacterized protein (DUF362 family)